MKIKQNLPSSHAEANWHRQLHRLDGAYADSTIRAYRTDALTFVRWCEKRKFSPFPASPENISDFVTHEAQHCSVSTIKRRIAAIGKIHRLMKLDNPTNDEDVKLALRRILRSKFSRPNQASGLTARIRDQLISCCETSLAGKRDRALITVGYDTLARRSELISICIEEVTFNANGARLLIKRAKNDPYGKGRISHLRPKTAQYLKDWIEVANITQGPLFRAIKHEKVQSKGLHPYSVNRIIKDRAKIAGFSEKEIQKLSGHSMRVGAAQDMMASGLNILPIMAAGGWKTTNVVARYIENTDLSPLLNEALK